MSYYLFPYLSILLIIKPTYITIMKHKKYTKHHLHYKKKITNPKIGFKGRPQFNVID